MFLDHISDIFKVETTTECDSNYCPKKKIKLLEKKVQSLPDNIDKWFFGKEDSTTCNRAFNMVPEGGDVPINYMDYTTEDGVVYVYITF